MPAMRYRCEDRGCFNRKKRPKIEVFDGCFPGGNALGDVDGLIERHGYGLMLEFKDEPQQLSAGQRKCWENLTVGRILSVIFLAGNAETMEITHMGFAVDGKLGSWKRATLDDAKQKVKDWWMWADKKPKRPA